MSCSLLCWVRWKVERNQTWERIGNKTAARELFKVMHAVAVFIIMEDVSRNVVCHSVQFVSLSRHCE